MKYSIFYVLIFLINSAIYSAPHIELQQTLPGIISLLAYCSETAKPLSMLAEVLLRGESTLSSGERELIASYVSFLNECNFCCNSHSAAAAHWLDNGALATVDAVKNDYQTAPISEKLKTLLAIAQQVKKNGKSVTPAHIARAKEAGATDKEIHDTVLIAAAFCMYNRYVDGLATWTPEDWAIYDAMGKELVQIGYIR
ncbi:MAG TPA: peroxidase-related enzyme [Candidatus Babeliales bacterium]|nr:peroxidase-related enzyme [Candidatus Babeliales bacterium]